MPANCPQCVLCGCEAWFNVDGGGVCARCIRGAVALTLSITRLMGRAFQMAEAEQRNAS